MKPVIDFNKLTTVIVEGERSYSDGRHDFNYELLTQVFENIGIKVNRVAAWKEIQRRARLYNARFLSRKSPVNPAPAYAFIVDGDLDSHFDSVFAPGAPVFPHRGARQKSPGFDFDNFAHSSPVGRWIYTAYDRKTAAELLRYIRSVHPRACCTVSIHSGPPRPVPMNTEPQYTETLLNCPFCGSAPTVESWHGRGPQGTLVCCANESCAVQPGVIGSTRERAISRWNHRVPATENETCD